MARLLGIPYPGGAALSKLARSGQVVYTLPKPMIDRNDGTMSFSGLKTASRLLWERLLKEHNGASDEVWQQLRADFAASFEHAIIDTLKTVLQKKYTDDLDLINTRSSNMVDRILILIDESFNRNDNKFYVDLTDLNDMRQERNGKIANKYSMVLTFN